MHFSKLEDNPSPLSPFGYQDHRETPSHGSPNIFDEIYDSCFLPLGLSDNIQASQIDFTGIVGNKRCLFVGAKTVKKQKNENKDRLAEEDSLAELDVLASGLQTIINNVLNSYIKIKNQRLKTNCNEIHNVKIDKRSSVEVIYKSIQFIENIFVIIVKKSVLQELMNQQSRSVVSLFQKNIKEASQVECIHEKKELLLFGIEHLVKTAKICSQHQNQCDPQMSLTSDIHDLSQMIEFLNEKVIELLNFKKNGIILKLDSLIETFINEVQETESQTSERHVEDERDQMESWEEQLLLDLNAPFSLLPEENEQPLLEIESLKKLLKSKEQELLNEQEFSLRALFDFEMLSRQHAEVKNRLDEIELYLAQACKSLENEKKINEDIVRTMSSQTKEYENKIKELQKKLVEIEKSYQNGIRERQESIKYIKQLESDNEQMKKDLDRFVLSQQKLLKEKQQLEFALSSEKYLNQW